jgi:hypothetical protein
MKVGHHVKLRIVLALWMLVLFPFAMSAKVITMLAYALVLVSTLCVAVKQTPRLWKFLVVSLIVMGLTFAIPVDIRLVYGDAFITRWYRVAQNEMAGEPDLTIGAKARWIIEVSTPSRAREE